MFDPSSMLSDGNADGGGMHWQCLLWTFHIPLPTAAFHKPTIQPTDRQTLFCAISCFGNQARATSWFGLVVCLPSFSAGPDRLWVKYCVLQKAAQRRVGVLCPAYGGYTFEGKSIEFVKVVNHNSFYELDYCLQSGIVGGHVAPSRPHFMV